MNARYRGVEAVGKPDFLNKVDLQSGDNLFMA